MSSSLNNFKEAPLAFTDLETTGDIFTQHEILEIGLVVVNQKTFEVIDELDLKIQPLHPEINIPRAMDLNAYSRENWKDAVSLKEGMGRYAQKTTGCIFIAFNATFDWGFINYAFEQTGVQDRMDYHRFDVMSMAYFKLKNKIEKWRLSSVAKYLGLPEEPMPHRAINGAYTALEVYKKLLEL